MTKLICMRGYSGSGKSTEARRIAKEIDAVVVNRDLLRKMMLGEWWTGDKDDEDRVTVAEEAQVNALLRAGTSVVVDATHLHAPYLRKWVRLATKLGVDFEVVDVHTDPVECRRRVYQRWCSEQGSEFARYLDPKVVDQQVKRFPVEKWPTITAQPFVVEPVGEYDPDLFDAVLFDIDGTLAHIPEGGRSPYDYSRVGDDDVDPIIAAIAQMIWDERVTTPGGPFVIIMSGRDDACYEATAKWLADNGISYDKLIMRPAGAKDSRGNKLPDYRVKYDMFNEHLRGQFNVVAVFDDRQQVVDMWRSLGLKCLQVAPGAF